MQSGKSWLRSGITLIEVVVGLALMASLLASALLAGSSHLRQMRAAADKRQATELLDRFLSQWSLHDFQHDHAVAASSRLNADCVISDPEIMWRRDAVQLSRPAIRITHHSREHQAGYSVWRVEIYMRSTQTRSAWAEVMSGATP